LGYRRLRPGSPGTARSGLGAECAAPAHWFWLGCLRASARVAGWWTLSCIRPAAGLASAFSRACMCRSGISVPPWAKPSWIKDGPGGCYAGAPWRPGWLGHQPVSVGIPSDCTCLDSPHSGRACRSCRGLRQSSSVMAGCTSRPVGPGAYCAGAWPSRRAWRRTSAGGVGVTCT